MEKWERSGEPHQSHAKVYADVNTDFVRLIKAIPAQSMELISYSPEGQAFLNANPRFAELIKFNSYRFQTLFARKIACYAKNAVTQKYPNRWLSCYDNFRFILQSTLNLFSKKDPLTGKIGVTVPDGTCAPDVIKDTITDSFKEYLGLLVNENCIISL